MKRSWESHEVETVRQLYPNSGTAEIAAALGRSVESVFRIAYKLGLRKSADFLASPASGRLDGLRGSASRFQPGQSSWNAGLKGWDAGGRCRETQFKKGRPPEKAHNYQPIGTERVNHDGYLERKVTDDPSLMPARRWVPVHRLVWEMVNGPIPAGHVVTFRPGRKTTDVASITADALELVSRAELARRNHPKNKSPELAKLVQLKGAITRQVNRLAREAKEQAA